MLSEKQYLFKTVQKVFCVFLFFIVYMTCVPSISQAATYSYDTGIVAQTNPYWFDDLSVQIIGFNKTHAITKMLDYNLITYSYSGKSLWRINYVVPDDGSTWDVTGVYIQYQNRQNYTYDDDTSGLKRVYAKTFTATHTTSGTYTGASIGTAVNAANAAKSSADTAASNAATASTAANTASTRALNAYNSVYNANGNTITAVRDGSGTVLSEARQAKTNASNAGTYASQASTNALNAYNTAQTVNTKIDSLSTAVTNIQNNIGLDTSPPVVQIATVSGALATSGNSISAVVNVSDNVSTAFEYSLNGTVYQSLPANGVVSLPISAPGANLITVWVKDGAGNVGRNSITIRKL